MDQNQIEPSREYGYRPTPRQHIPLERVRVVEKVRSQWKVEWVEPSPGLRDYVKSSNLIVPWGERRPFFRDEESWDRLVKASASSWPGVEHPLCDAVDTVLASTGETISLGTRGVLSATADSLERVAARSSNELLIELPGFRDRRGTIHLPFDDAVTFAQAFAAAEPQSVLLEVDSAQRHYETAAREPGNLHLVPLVHRWRASWALCRQWAGFDQALAERDVEINRLRRIIDDLRYELQRAGHDELAAELNRKLKAR